MQLGGGAVVGDVTVHGEAVLGLRVDLDRVTHSRVGERLAKSNLLLGREARVDLRRTNVDARPHLRRQSMGTLRLVSRKRPAVKRRRDNDAIGKRSRGTQGVTSTHAVAECSQATLL